MKTSTTLLHWYPRDPAKELARAAALSLAARGAVETLRDHAWSAGLRGAAPCTLPADPAVLTRLLGVSRDEWDAIAGEVLPLFEQRDGLLVDTSLLELWEGQKGAYERRVQAGAKGNQEKAARRGGERKAPRNASRNASPMRTQEEVELEPDGVPPVLTDQGGTPASESPRAALTGAQRSTRSATITPIADAVRAAGFAQIRAAVGAPPAPVTEAQLQAFAARHPGIVELCEARVDSDLAEYAADDRLVQATRPRRIRRALEEAFRRHLVGGSQVELPILASEAAPRLEVAS